MTREEHSLVLHVGFDVDQKHPNLSWALYDGDSSSLPDKGTHAGMVRFIQGKKMYLEVAGYSSREGEHSFTAFQIIQCCLVTRPMVVRCHPEGVMRYAVPSPFLQCLGASHIFNNDFEVNVWEWGKYRGISQTAKQALDIGTEFGSWELSLNLTVRILRGPDQPIEIRVFQFDPEVQVGDGTRPGNPPGGHAPFSHSPCLEGAA